MKLKGKATKVLLAISVLGILAIASGIWYSNIDNGKGSSGWGGISLVRPAFAQDEATSFLEKEAGMAAYTNLGQKIDLAKAKKAFRTIEKDTDTYVVGSVPVPGYESAMSEDVHCFIHKDGWIVSYYLRDEITSKIMYWGNWDGKTINTKTEAGLIFASSVLGLTPTNVKYYHFKYPEANKLMIIAKKGAFKLTIPSGLVIHERSYSTSTLSASDYGRDTRGSLNVDGQNLGYGIGLITFSQFKPDVAHSINFSEGYSGVIMLIYQAL